MIVMNLASLLSFILFGVSSSIIHAFVAPTKSYKATLVAPNTKTALSLDPNSILPAGSTWLADELDASDVYDQFAAAAGKSIETAATGEIDPETKALVGAVGFWILVSLTAYAAYITISNFFRERQLNEIEKQLEQEVRAGRPGPRPEAGPDGQVFTGNRRPFLASTPLGVFGSL
mmetsp:Transcript_5331/g.8498  ORF Transcript_5331/g.8498 Transcript_5331/m.8498 type:complete len:175 (-) Transcript_5331:333-857(-)